MNTVPCSKKVKVAIIGDSITYGDGVKSYERYASLLEEEFYIASIQNLGINGSTIGRGQDPISERFTDIDKDTEVIIVFAGTNDYGSTNNPVPIGTKDDTTTVTFYGALHVLYEGLIREYPTAKLVFITMLKRNDQVWGKPATTPYNIHGFMMNEYYQTMTNFYKDNNLDYIDLYHHIELNPMDLELCDKYFLDGLHPNKEGHEGLKETINNSLMTILKIERNR